MTGLRIGIASLTLLAACSGASGTDPAPTTITEPAGTEITTTTTEAMPPTAAGGEMLVTIPPSLTRDFELVGTLLTPTGEGPFDAVVIIHGSGPNDRDGALPGQLNQLFPSPVSTYRDLAEGLADVGIMALRYDKRTCGSFNGCAANEYPTPGDDLLIDDFVSDAADAAAWLSARPEVDRVFLVGHSQGSEFLPHLLFRYPTLEGGVLLGAPFGPIDDVLAQQAEFSRQFAQVLGYTEAQINAAVGPLEELAEAVTELRGTATDDFIGGASAAFWRSWMALGDAGRQLAPSLAAPLLIIGGENDFNVRTSEFDRWVAALEGSIHETLLLDCVTHAMNCVNDIPAFVPQPADVGEAVDQRVIDAIAEFIARS